MIPVIKEMSEHRRKVTFIFQNVDFRQVSNALTDNIVSNIAMNQYPQWIKKHEINSAVVSDYMRNAISANLVSCLFDILSHSQYPEFIQLATELGITSDVASLAYKLSSQWRVPQDIANIVQLALSPILLDDGSIILSVPSDLDKENVSAYLSKMALNQKDYGIISYLSPATIKLASQSGSRNVLTMIVPSTSINTEKISTTEVAAKIAEIKEYFSKSEDSASTLRIHFKGDALASQLLVGATVGKTADGKKLKLLQSSIDGASSEKSITSVGPSSFLYPENKENLIGYGIPYGVMYTTMPNALCYTMYNRRKELLASSAIAGVISSTFEHDYGEYRAPDDMNFKAMLYETWRNIK